MLAASPCFPNHFHVRNEEGHYCLLPKWKGVGEICHCNGKARAKDQMLWHPFLHHCSPPIRRPSILYPSTSAHAQKSKGINRKSLQYDSVFFVWPGSILRGKQKSWLVVKLFTLIVNTLHSLSEKRVGDLAHGTILSVWPFQMYAWSKRKMHCLCQNVYAILTAV